jgi:methyl-accepting chemotaxis protein
MIRANETANSLGKIVGNIMDISEVINMIQTVSDQQTEAIDLVGVGLEQINQVVQVNSATSEEAAAYSEELNSQADMLKQMISFFRIAEQQSSYNEQVG